jgi:hypothetical protein
MLNNYGYGLIQMTCCCSYLFARTSEYNALTRAPSADLALRLLRPQRRCHTSARALCEWWSRRRAPCSTRPGRPRAAVPSRIRFASLRPLLLPRSSRRGGLGGMSNYRLDYATIGGGKTFCTQCGEGILNGDIRFQAFQTYRSVFPRARARISLRIRRAEIVCERSRCCSLRLVISTV